MAPKRIASLFRQASMVSSGNGLPVLSMAIAPIRQYLYSNSWLNLSATAFSTLSDCLVTSGPMPSPSITTIFLRICFASFLGVRIVGFLVLYLISSQYHHIHLAY